MGRFWAVVGLLVAIAVIYLLVLAGKALIAAAARRNSGPDEWEVRKRKVGNGTQVQLEKRGESPYLIGSVVGIDSVLYDDEVLTLVIEGQDRADTLNRRLPA